MTNRPVQAGPRSTAPSAQPLRAEGRGARAPDPAQRARLLREAQVRQWENARRAWQHHMTHQYPRDDGLQAPAPEEGPDGTGLPDEAAKPPVLPEMKNVDAVVKFWRATGDQETALAQLKRLAAADASVLNTVVALAGQDDRELKLFAAAGLAAIGTTEAAGKLAELIIGTPAGDLKTDLVEVAANLSNRQAVPFLFEIIRVSGDDDLLQAAQRALANMDDQALFGMVVARYAQSQDENEKDNLLGSIRHISNTNAVGYMADLVSMPDTTYADPLALAVIDTLGIIGTPQAVEALVRLIGKIPEDQSPQELADALGRVTNPDALSLLVAIARGRSAAAVPARVAALQALTHYDATAMVPTLTAIVQGEQNPDIRAAAEAALAKFGVGRK